jgi:hypothetical protein
MKLAQEHEAVFAAAAHYFTATRMYTDAIAVLQCCQALTGYPKPDTDTKRQLEAVQRLATQLFTGWPKAYRPAPAELGELRHSLRTLRRQLIGKTRGRPTKTIYQLLGHVERRPGLYLKRLSIERLKDCIGQTLYPSPLKLGEGDPPFRSFAAWIDRRYSKLQGGGYGWDDILLRAARGDEEKAVRLFFKELRAFRRAEKDA